MGLTWADIVFPCFMFLAGCSLAVVTLRVPATGNLIGTALDRTTVGGRSLADRMAGHFAGFGGEGRYLVFAIACTVVATAIALTLDALDRTARCRRRFPPVHRSFGFLEPESESIGGDGAHTGVNDLRRPRSVASGGDFSQERVQ